MTENYLDMKKKIKESNPTKDILIPVHGPDLSHEDSTFHLRMNFKLTTTDAAKIMAVYQDG